MDADHNSKSDLNQNDHEKIIAQNVAAKSKWKTNVFSLPCSLSSFINYNARYKLSFDISAQVYRRIQINNSIRSNQDMD